MLELKQIKKDYPAGGETVHALKGVSLQFRKNEFVSILGPSGCGKTTMLNIIGGLDQYSDGDLIINGISTKNYRDRDWDAYRNHSVGFVFQSYNLIPHQSVLQNVELALTLSGVSKAERRRRAKEALVAVGLGDQLKKRPGEMSGGQMQRVAIARAIVNDPDIILADEPTGALDSETSVQVMEILKEISKNRLVIMVTHNPDLAEQYSTRIVRMLDGEITDDSAPPAEEEMAAPAVSEKSKKTKKPSMSFFTAFGLSLKNLFTKRGRTVLTSFAGSIGIIGIALIYAVSNGMTTYIDTVQEDTLASYPLTLEEQHMDMGTLMATFIDAAQSREDHGDDAVYEKPVLHDLVNALNSVEAHENDLKSFKAWLEEERANPESSLHTAVSGVQYTYAMDLLVYTKAEDGTIIHSDTEELMQTLLARYFGQSFAESQQTMSSSMTSMMPSTMMPGSTLWQEMLSGDNGKLISPLLEKQYDVVYGSWPNSYNEIVLVLDENNEINDMALYALGLLSEDEINAIVDAAINKETLPDNDRKWTYEEICAMEFRTVLGADCYTKDEKSGLYTDLRETSAGLKYLYDNGIALKVSGIVRPNEDALSGMLVGSIAYTGALTQHVIEKTENSAALKAQLADDTTDIFTDLPFKELSGVLTDKEKEKEFRAHVKGLNNKGKAEAYIKIMSIPPQEQVDATVKQTLGSMDRAAMEKSITQALAQQTGMSKEELSSYIADMSDEDLKELFTQAIVEQFTAQYAAGVKQQLAAFDTAQLAAMLKTALPSYTTKQCAEYYEAVLVFSESTYEENLRKLSYVDPEDPAGINLYAATFAEKDVIEEAISHYNEGIEDELSRITYTDYVGLMMSSVTTIINAITYVLIAFVAVSLVVSSIMIGVITLISVQERTKEIGILRAIGASKRNVSSMFNAETMIIGFTSGLFGIGLTYALCIPINLILNALTGIANLRAALPINVAVVLIVISVLLTLVAGVIPSRSAARKDPVVALRTE
ncbi:MAG: ABC transporter ATP-binding protein/permease [Clostridia bacterium]|nr:ABC transporter ATP-binding protein/permease [Clostridia bacterium]